MFDYQVMKRFGIPLSALPENSVVINKPISFFVVNGYSELFVEKENFLCARSKDGTIVRKADGLPVWECTCGLVLSGGADLSHPFFTKGGSFWTNEASKLLELKPEEDPRTNPRNQCIYEGYESMRRKQAKEALKQSEEKFRSLFNNALVGMFRTRIDGLEILDMNESFLNIFGYTHEEMQSSPSVSYWAGPTLMSVRRWSAYLRLKAA